MSSIPPPPPTSPTPGGPPMGMPPMGMPPASTPFPPAPAAAPAPSGPIRPRLAWVALAIVLMVGGLIAGGAIAVVGFISAIKDVTGCDDCRIDEPGTYQLDASSPGVFFLYMEDYTDAAAGKAAFRELDVDLVDVNGDAVDLNRYNTDFNMSFDGVDLVAVATFEVDDDLAPYTLTVADPNEQGVAMRFGGISASDVIKPVAIGLAVGGGLFIIGLVILIVTLVKRSKNRKRQRQAQGPPPGMTAWGTTPSMPPTVSTPPTPWGTPPPPPPGQWNPPQ